VVVVVVVVVVVGVVVVPLQHSTSFSLFSSSLSSSHPHQPPLTTRRKRLGLLPRSIRAAVIGYPNVGKSALINKLLGRRIAKSKNIPGGR